MVFTENQFLCGLNILCVLIVVKKVSKVHSVKSQTKKNKIQ